MFITGSMRVTSNYIGKLTGRGGGYEAPRLMSVQHRAALTIRLKFWLRTTFDADEISDETVIPRLVAVAVAQGDISAQSMSLAHCRDQVHDIFARIAAMNQAISTACHEQVERAACCGQVVVGVR